MKNQERIIFSLRKTYEILMMMMMMMMMIIIIIYMPYIYHSPTAKSYAGYVGR